MIGSGTTGTGGGRTGGGLRSTGGGNVAPVVTYVGGRFHGASVPPRSAGSRTFAQLLESVPAGHWRATIWASFGEADGGSGSVNRAVEFDVLPDE